MCSEEELDELYSILHGKSPFSPVVKSLVKENEPAMCVALRGRGSIMHKVRWFCMVEDRVYGWCRAMHGLAA